MDGTERNPRFHRIGRLMTTAVAVREFSLAGGLEAFAPVSLADVTEQADLAERVDRKYLVDLETIRRIFAELSDSHRVLEIDGRRTTTYSTTYFDTPDMASCRAHIQGRRRRWKVRSRLYVEDGLCRVEVKTKNGRGMTVKAAAPSHVDRHDLLADGELLFVGGVLAADHPEVEVESLTPTSRITYTRACLADLTAQTRLTIDWKLSSALDASRVWIDDFYAIVETKGGQVPSTADRLLSRLGAQTRPFSKYVATTSLMRADIADNDVRALHGTQLHSDPTRP